VLLGCGNFKEQVITQPFIKNYMQALVKKENEPITPFISKIRSLLARGVSSILVMGGSGDYFGVSDTVLRMDSYKASDVTAEALAIDKRFGAAPSLADNKKQYGTVASRTPVTIYPGSPSGDWHDSDAATHLALSSKGLSSVKDQGHMGLHLYSVAVLRKIGLTAIHCVVHRTSEDNDTTDKPDPVW
jgi:hypothetical protein